MAKWKPTERARAVELFREGFKPTAIAELLQVSAWSVYQWLRRAGFRTDVAHPHTKTDEVLAVILMVTAGWRNGEIAAALLRSTAWVRKQRAAAMLAPAPRARRSAAELVAVRAMPRTPITRHHGAMLGVMVRSYAATNTSCAEVARQGQLFVGMAVSPRAVHAARALLRLPMCVPTTAPSLRTQSESA